MGNKIDSSICCYNKTTANENSQCNVEPPSDYNNNSINVIENIKNPYIEGNEYVHKNYSLTKDKLVLLDEKYKNDKKERKESFCNDTKKKRKSESIFLLSIRDNNIEANNNIIIDVDSKNSNNSCNKRFNIDNLSENEYYRNNSNSNSNNNKNSKDESYISNNKIVISRQITLDSEMKQINKILSQKRNYDKNNSPYNVKTLNLPKHVAEQLHKPNEKNKFSSFSLINNNINENIKNLDTKEVTENDYEFLSTCLSKALPHFESENIREIISNLIFCRFGKGKILLNSDEDMIYVFIIKTGRLGFYHGNELIDIFMKGDLVGDYSFINNEFEEKNKYPNGWKYKCITDTEIFFMSSESLRIIHSEFIEKKYNFFYEIINKIPFINSFDDMTKKSFSESLIQIDVSKGMKLQIADAKSKKNNNNSQLYDKTLASHNTNNKDNSFLDEDSSSNVSHVVQNSIVSGNINLVNNIFSSSKNKYNSKDSQTVMSFANTDQQRIIYVVSGEVLVFNKVCFNMNYFLISNTSF